MYDSRIKFHYIYNESNMFHIIYYVYLLFLQNFQNYFEWRHISFLTAHRCKYNGIWCDCHTSGRLSAIKLGSIHHFLYLKMPIPNIRLMCFINWLFHLIRDFRFEFSLTFSIFVILLFGWLICLCFRDPIDELMLVSH